ncbi:MAG: transcriptional regulator [Herbinix sp.]|jgi:MarR family transcriptional regulator for hemolysin|nr:transcriptional regulator [Herbinix sp.]
MLKDKDIGYILHKAAMASKNYYSNKLNIYGITPGQFTVIKEIYNHQENSTDLGLSPACIADGLECDRPTISGIIDRLEAQEWIVRLHNPDDKRSFLIQLTEKAIDSLKELEEIKQESQKVILDGFTEEEAILFHNYLMRVINNYKAME